MEISQEDISELLVLLNHALAEVNDELARGYVLPITQAHAEARREALRTWIHRLSQAIQ